MKKLIARQSQFLVQAGALIVEEQQINRLAHALQLFHDGHVVTITRNQEHVKLLRAEAVV